MTLEWLYLELLLSLLFFLLVFVFLVRVFRRHPEALYQIAPTCLPWLRPRPPLVSSLSYYHGIRVC
jgi:hypothetical protein